MKVTILNMDDRSARFVLKGVSSAFANALRRIMLAEVPCMAIDEVFIVENQSALFDEELAHRLGLIPLKTDLKSYVLPEKCSCQSELGCPKCRVTLTLDVKAPSDRFVTVYSHDLKSEDPKIVSATGDIPIVKLAPTQRVRMEAYARLGLGKDHAKWKPVAVSAYKYYPVIKIDARRCNLCGKCVEICPTRVFEIVEQKLVIRDLLACMSCRDCEKECPFEPPVVKIGWDENAFVFVVEGTGVLPVPEVIEASATILKDKARTLAKEAKKL